MLGWCCTGSVLDKYAGVSPFCASWCGCERRTTPPRHGFPGANPGFGAAPPAWLHYCFLCCMRAASCRRERERESAEGELASDCQQQLPLGQREHSCKPLPRCRAKLLAVRHDFRPRKKKTQRDIFFFRGCMHAWRAFFWSLSGAVERVSVCLREGKLSRRVRSENHASHSLSPRPTRVWVE